MNNQEFKQLFIDRLFDRGLYTKKVDNTQFRTRCPLCGDSKNLNTGHFYIKVNPDDNLPIVFICFKCGEQGILKDSHLDLLELTDNKLKSSLNTLNKSCDKVDKKQLNETTNMLHFDYKIPEQKYCKKISYIENRLGLRFSEKDISDMKIVTSLRDFLIYNDIKVLTCPNNIAHIIERDYVGFLSYGNSHILFRDITNTNKISWIKYPITEDSKKTKIFYSVASEIDIYDRKDININIAEGVMDILSVKYNLCEDQKNSINIAVGGRYFDRILLTLVDMGFVGNNIIINIYADNDEKFNKKNTTPTTISYFRQILQRYKYLYKKINIYYNKINKDVGVPKEQILLTKYTI